ncbi:MAG: methyltransferase domain-containing protein [Myxococcota bacterium]|nr:methyltransferase domain-containing protein [Myxococcota bacterium]
MTRTTTMLGVLASASVFVGACGTKEVTRGPEPTLIAPSPVEIQRDAAEVPTRKPDVIYVPTPEPVVKRMLTMAKVGPKDVVYDLGCGDGRIVIAAARDFGARGVGIDIDPQRVKEARANVEKAGVGDKVEIRQGDLFKLDLAPASVVTLYLLETLNEKLRPKLQRELRPGSRVVSQSFSMGTWQPAEEDTVNGTKVYLWNIRPRSASK